MTFLTKEALMVEVERLRVALKPFAALYEQFPHNPEAFKDPGFLKFLDSNVVIPGGITFCRGDFRKAHHAISSTSPSSEVMRGLVAASESVAMNGHFELCPILGRNYEDGKQDCTCGHSELVKRIDAYHKALNE